jgi:hypothetical protein
MAQLINRTMVPSQMRPRQSIVEPRAYNPNEWAFRVGDTGRFNWRPGNTIQNDDNWRDLKEGYQSGKNSMYRQLTGQEQIYGHIDYSMNPLRQDQTVLPVHNIQKATRVTDNEDPNIYIRTNSDFYPSNLSNPRIFGNYRGSRQR